MGCRVGGGMYSFSEVQALSVRIKDLHVHLIDRIVEICSIQTGYDQYQIGQY